jgi:hypothetical protein
MRTLPTIALGIPLALLSGCANSERVYENVYEGLKAREAAVHPSTEQEPPEKSMSYQEYEAERKKLLNSKDGQ